MVVKTINEEAKTEEMKFRQKAIQRIKMKPVYDELNAASGIPLGLDDSLPWTEEALDEFMDNSYKSNEALIVHTLLEYNVELYNWKLKRIQLWREVQISGRAFCTNEIVNGFVQPRVIDPLTALFDPYVTDDLGTDQQMFGEAWYATTEEVIERYNLTKAEIDAVYEKYMNAKNELLWKGFYSTDTGDRTMLFAPFSNINGSMRVFVYKAQWLDYANKKVKVTNDKYGNEHVHLFDDNDDIKLTQSEKDAGATLETRAVAIVRQADLIGGELMKNWGPAPNQVRDVDNPSITRLNTHILLPNYVKYNSVSKVWELKSLQDFMNVLMYKTEWEIASSGRKGFTINVNMIPDKYDFDDIVYYSKAFGVVPIQQTEEQRLAGENLIDNYDTSIGQNIISYMNVRRDVEAQMDVVSGSTKASRGIQQSANQGLGLTKALTEQSNLTVEQDFELFQMFESNILKNQADLMKILWAGDPEKYKPILGELGISFLEQDVNVDLSDYGVFVKSLPPTLRDQERLAGFIDLATAQGLPLDIGLELLEETNPRRASAKFKREYKKFRKEQQENKMAAIQAEGENMQKAQGAKSQGDAQKIQMQGQIDMGIGREDNASREKQTEMREAAKMKTKEGEMKLKQTEIEKDLLKFIEEGKRQS